MMFRKKPIILLLLAILGLVIGTLFYVYRLKQPTPTKRISIQASIILYRESGDLINDSDLIAIASPLDAFEDREPSTQTYSDGEMMSFHTNTRIKLSKILKNTTDLNLEESSEMTITEPIMRDRNALGEMQIIMINDYVELEAGKEYLMFIKMVRPGSYGLCNLNNGKFELNQLPDASKSSNEGSDTIHDSLKSELFDKYGLK